MARYSYPYEVWSPRDDYAKPEPMARFRDVYEAVRFVSICEDGSTVRHLGRIAYRQGVDGDAGESFDVAVEVIDSRRGPSRA
jgi:hypothetical protein